MVCFIWRLTDSDPESLPSCEKSIQMLHFNKKTWLGGGLAGVRRWNCVLPPSPDVVHTAGSKYLPAASWVSRTERNSFRILFVHPCSFLSNVLVIHFHLAIYNDLQVFSSKIFAEQVAAHVFMQWICLCLSVFLAVQLSPLNFTLLFSTFYRLRKYRILSLTSRMLEFNQVWECVFSFS